jgi:hypothetical protein
MFQDKSWPMLDNACPRSGWHYNEYMKHATKAGKDEHGAIFFYVRDLLTKFCTRVQNLSISFTMYSKNARELGSYLQDVKFDRVEVRPPPFSPPHATLSHLNYLSRSPTSATAATSALPNASLSSRPSSSLTQ